MFCGFGALNESSLTEAPSIDELIGSGEEIPDQPDHLKSEGTPSKHAGDGHRSIAQLLSEEAADERQTSKEFDQQRALQLQKKAFNAQV